MLLVSRIVAGAMGATVGVAQAYIADITTPERRAHAMGILGAAFAMGFILGPALGGILSQPQLRQRRRGGRGTVRGQRPGRPRVAARNTQARGRSPVGPDPARCSGGPFRGELLRHRRFRRHPRHPAALRSRRVARLDAADGDAVRLHGHRFGDRAGRAGGPAGRAGGGETGGGGGRVSCWPSAWRSCRRRRRGWCCTLSLGALSAGSALATPSLFAIVSRRATAWQQGAALGITQTASTLGRIVGPTIAGFLIGAAGLRAPFWAGALLWSCWECSPRCCCRGTPAPELT